LVQRLDVNVCDDLSDLWKVGRREDQVTQDLQRIGLGVCGDTELGLSRASLTGFDPDPVPMQIVIHAPILPSDAARPVALVDCQPMDAPWSAGMPTRWAAQNA
jgi:hypothetical protein